MNKLACILMAWLLLGALPVLAAERAETGVAWESLDESTQDLLAGQKERWNSLPPERQRAMADGAERWLSMNDSDRVLARERWNEVARPPARGTRAAARALEAVPQPDARATRGLARKLSSLHGASSPTARHPARALATDVARGAAPRDPAPTRPEARHDRQEALPALLRTRIRRTTVGGLFPRCPMRRSSARMTG